MTADDVQAPSNVPVSERIYLSLRQDIMRCEIAPGVTLDAAAIARRYAVSKTPVRDAMQKLAGDGLVIILPRSGYRVAPITFQAVHEILDLRAAIGPHAARQAARYATSADIDELRHIVAEYAAPLDIGAMQQVARRFHVAIARCSRNRRVVALTEALFDELERLLRFAIDFTVKAGEHSGEHTDLVDAIEAGDGNRAAQIEAGHIASSRQFLIERLITLGYLSEVELAQGARVERAAE
ncbi:MAG: GntR family transcriptional regulator [Chelatococcus sp.]|jgi:DNA-binding GntR family transcriptional regulator|uniref:GntR family transcriptional regulator n=1 Tax=unclassified Chelatococcus TaxID=2638111 RepID=UPI001BD11131|nr:MULTISPECIES: GntR family transcriptional regulator [unclassified Chelatococcus]CAH1658204.1 DNA-binding GntR family transcriptional regulator [Hyphomicrobiales bacterium]MBS7742204.1 GntR family transcriptional regulator [Chelatococcus sp. HY11]MBX3539144.1 GntR family transcriptional regulator [Chelatococcus sp.]MBX3542678.1 GntR family transcriptional regulator [Chelatococcus sp.]MCO5075106.1 GntR family transcriptional regulator [Chelatococcus sp.]